MADFVERAGVSVEDWFCTILAERRYPEPDTLPCSNGIDFYAHEVFGGRAGYVRRLLEMGHRELALEAATEIDHRVEDMEPILVELGDSADAEICRRASWHLSYHYRRLHPAGAARGFVARRALPVTRIYSSTSSIRWTARTMRTRRRSFRRSANHSRQPRPRCSRSSYRSRCAVTSCPTDSRATAVSRVVHRSTGLPALDIRAARCFSFAVTWILSVGTRSASSGTEPREPGVRKIATNRPPWWALNKHGSKLSRESEGSAAEPGLSESAAVRDIRNRRRRQ